MEDRLTRIGIFYDGNYFSTVSNYYNYNHKRRARISIEGLHRFIRWQVAQAEDTDERHCQVVDAHYFRGRISALEAQERKLLYGERAFEDVLMRSGVTTHYLPTFGFGEKGIDVWFALEAFELAIYKRFTVSVLVTGDGDYVPLVRKLNTLGTRVMLLGWDFTYKDQEGKTRSTGTSKDLIEEVTYPIAMDRMIEDNENARASDPIIDNIFLTPRQEQNNTAGDETGQEPLETSSTAAPGTEIIAPESDRVRGKVKWFDSEKGYGWLLRPGSTDLYVHQSDVKGHPSVLKSDDEVEYVVGSGPQGPVARNVRLIK